VRSSAAITAGSGQAAPTPGRPQHARYTDDGDPPHHRSSSRTGRRFAAGSAPPGRTRFQMRTPGRALLRGRRACPCRRGTRRVVQVSHVNLHGLQWFGGASGVHLPWLLPPAGRVVVAGAAGQRLAGGLQPGHRLFAAAAPPARAARDQDHGSQPCQRWNRAVSRPHRTVVPPASTSNSDSTASTMRLSIRIVGERFHGREEPAAGGGGRLRSRLIR
jgi:hypothetical protein